MLDCVQVEVTSRCLGQCRYCPHTVYHKQWRSGEMPMETFRRLWPLLRRTERVHLQGWGEPMLNPAFFEMAALARKAGCSVSTTTCGLGLNDQRAADLVNSELDLVAFSLTGTDRESNADRRGIPFDEVIAGVKQLQTVRRARGAVHMEIHFAYLLLASRMSAVRGLPALMQRLGVHAAVVSTLDYIPHAGLSADAFPPDAIGRRVAAEAILAATQAGAHRLNLEFEYALPHWGQAQPGCRERIDRSLFVSFEGDLSPCVYLNIPAAGLEARRRVFGNVNSEDPVSIWEKQDYQDFRQALRADEPDRACHNCPKRFVR